ncbi:hypothetical protein FRC18_004837 [Serendipita sp. 400]|nr:hypothetical protein FRC18_004837 [Serendipita sp. 400]
MYPYMVLKGLHGLSLWRQCQSIMKQAGSAYIDPDKRWPTTRQRQAPTNALNPFSTVKQIEYFISGNHAVIISRQSLQGDMLGCLQCLSLAIPPGPRASWVERAQG